MIECHKCGEKFKNKQGLKGHQQFKHSNFIKIRSKRKRAEWIDIGSKVIRRDDLSIDLDSAVKLKKLAIQWGWNIEEVIDNLISLVPLENQTAKFKYTDCIYCERYFWAPSEDEVGEGGFYCSFCGKSMIWK